VDIFFLGWRLWITSGVRALPLARFALSLALSRKREREI
jgi:hypothetical protein